MKDWPKIAVVGAGAIGCYFGSLLARAGMNVTLIGRPRHVDAINQGGLSIRGSDFDWRIRVPATTEPAAVKDARLVLFCVKSRDTDTAAQAIAPFLASDAVVLSLQNGIDNVERIRAHVKNVVLPVLVYAAAQMQGPGSVKFTGGGNVVIGRTGKPDRTDAHLMSEIAALFTAAGIAVRVSDNIEADLWTKLAMNCAYNAISALGGARYGEMVAMPEIRSLMLEVVAEIVQVANAKGIRLPKTIADDVMSLANAMAYTMSSTAQDILNGRPTEIDHLNGYVVRQGDALGIPTPVNHTLHALVKLLERTKSSASA